MEIISITEPCALLAELASAFLQGRRGPNKPAGSQVHDHPAAF
jgi:hypothetical protein